MKFRKYPSPPELQALVVNFWSLEIPKIISSLELRLFAQVLPEIVFIQGNLTDVSSPSGKLHIYGSQPHPQTLFTKGMRLTGATLFPSALRLFFKTPPQIFYNTHFPAVELLGREVQGLEEVLGSTSDARLQVELLANFLRAHVEPVGQPALVKILPTIVKAGGQTSPEKLAEEVGLSRRHFERKFRELTGLSPALFCRLIKFRKAVNLSAKHLSLTEIGIESGYYDQSHFIRDFKKFAGLSPKFYFHKKGEVAENLIPWP